MPLHIAYLVNQYPKVSHTFIRREIHALERRGFKVLRMALRGWNAELADPQDERERGLTRYALRGGPKALLLAALYVALRFPRRLFSGLVLAIRMARRSDRALPYHLVYLAEACRILRWVKSFEANHLHAHFGTNSAEIAMLVHALGGPPYSFTVHGSDEFDRLQLLGIDEKLRRAAFVVSVSSYGRSQIYRSADHTQWPKVKLVHCGVDEEFYDVAHVPVPAAPRLVCVGRLSAEKGQLLLVDAVARVVHKGLAIELVLAGDGEIRPRVEELIAHYGLSEQVRITGWISGKQVRDEILAARALVLPSFIEGLPVVIMEAMALRRPVLATFVGGVPELVRPGATGWLFPAGSVDDLAATIETCLSTSVARLREMGEAAYVLVTEQHSVDREAGTLARLFRQSLEREESAP